MKTTREEAASRGGETGMEGLKEIYDQAQPLGALNEIELRRLRRRVRQTLLRHPARLRSSRMGTVLATLALLLLGGMGYAAADHLGWVKNPWKAAPAILPEAGKAGGGHPRRSVHVAKSPASTPAPAVALPVFPDPVLPMDATLVPMAPANHPAAMPDSRPSTSVPMRRRARLDLASKSDVAMSPRPVITRDPAPSPATESPVVEPVEDRKPDPASSFAGASAAPSSEPGLLRVAMRKLRHENDPAGALALLSDLAKRFPSGALAGERATLEVEALLGLRREAEALSRLDGMNLGELPRSGERFVLRGELRARAHRHAEAAADFDRALSRVSGSPAWHERALWGRAVSRLHNQQRQQGIADLEDYLEQYPKGGHAAEANALLRTR